MDTIPSELVCTKCPCTAFADEKFFFCERQGRKMYRRYAELCRLDKKNANIGRLSPGETSEEPGPQSPQRGPGTELHKMLKTPMKVLGFLWQVQLDPDCPSCKSFAAKMDRWGVAGCRERIDEITDHLKEQAEEDGLPFSRPIAKLLIYRAIRQARSWNEANP